MTQKRSEATSFALCLSGGGLRATFYHLGTICALRDVGLLPRVASVFAVSGGSILAAHLVANWNRYTTETGKDDDFVAAVDEVKQLASYDIRGRIIRRWILSLLIASRTRLMQRIIKRFVKRDSFVHVYNSQPSAPEIFILSTSMRKGVSVSFSKNGFSYSGDKKTFNLSTGIPFGEIALATTASSAFPPLFPPVKVTIKGLPDDYLTDGGVFDNSGISQAMESGARANDEDTSIIVSDASAPFDVNYSEEFQNIVSRNIRAFDILFRRVAEIDAAASRPNISPLRTSLGEKRSEINFPIPSYVQEAVEAIRTDLNVFTAIEVNILVASGYLNCIRILLANNAISQGDVSIANRDGVFYLPNLTDSDAWREISKGLKYSSKRSSEWRRWESWKAVLLDWASYPLILMLSTLVAVPVYAMSAYPIQRMTIEQLAAVIAQQASAIENRDEGQATASEGRDLIGLLANALLALTSDREDCEPNYSYEEIRALIKAANEIPSSDKSYPVLLERARGLACKPVVPAAPGGGPSFEAFLESIEK